jgi:hypothetical protein
VRLRLHGTLGECQEAARRLAEVFQVVAVSPPYPDRGPSTLVRVRRGAPLAVRIVTARGHRAPPGSFSLTPNGSSRGSTPSSPSVTIRASPGRHQRFVTTAQAVSRASVTIRPSPAAAPMDRNSNPSKQGGRYGPTVSRCYEPTATGWTLACPTVRHTPSSAWAPALARVARDVPVVPRRGVRGEDASSPRPGCRPARPEARGAARARCPAVKRECPAPRRSAGPRGKPIRA